jgi:hypothetical protein
MSSTLPATAVIRVSQVTFDPARFDEVERMAHDTGTFLIPAISRLPGLLKYFVAVSSGISERKLASRTHLIQGKVRKWTHRP